MPVGPSHSGRSRSPSGRSSFGGGSSRRSGFSSSSSSNQSNPNGNFHGFAFFRPRHYHIFGRPVFISSGIQTLISSLLFFALITLFFAFSYGSSVTKAKEDITDCKEYISVIESDAEYYNNLIQTAKTNNTTDNYYIAQAYFGNTVYEYYSANPKNIGAYEAFTDDGIIWYFIVYEYTNEVIKAKQIGTTYTQYSSSQHSGLDGVIEVAYTKTGSQWFSINTDYTLSENRDYILAKEELSELESWRKNCIKNTITTSLIFAIFVAIIVLIFVYKYKKAKTENELNQQKTKAEIAEAQAKAQQEQRKAAQINRTCEYCGSTVPDNAKKCPACGSSNFN